MSNTLKRYTVKCVYSFELEREVEAHNEYDAEEIALVLNTSVNEQGLLEALSNGWKVEATYANQLTE